MLAFILILRSLNENFAEILDLQSFYYGAFWGFLIGLNQDFQIKGGLRKGKEVRKTVGLSVLLNLFGTAAAALFFDHYINILLFALASSGRYEIVKYDGTSKVHKLQTVIATAAALLCAVLIYAFGGDGMMAVLVAYILFKIAIGEALLAVLVLRTQAKQETETLSFSKALFFSGLIATGVGTLIPIGVAGLAESPNAVMFAFLVIQRSLSPAQQIGSLTSRPYETTLQLFREQLRFSLLGSLLSLTIYLFLKWGDVSLLDAVLITVIGYHASLSGSWTLNVTIADRQEYEFFKILLSMVAMAGAFGLAILYGFDQNTSVILAYFTHLVFLYIPQFYFRTVSVQSEMAKRNP